jgi:hypothetical protein
MDPDRHGQRRKAGFMWIRQAGILLPENTPAPVQNRDFLSLDLARLS